MKIIECPRDAMQGISQYIPAETKAEYINALLRVGFDTIDFGSFVSPKAIPQLRDTADVLNRLDLEKTNSSLLAIVANERGAKEACNFEEINYLGFPFSISETFQKRNINSTISESYRRLSAVREICFKHNKKLVTYFSMAFGNPYGDEWSTYIVAHWAEKLLKDLEIKILSLSDTIGTSNRENIQFLFEKLIPEFPEVEFGAHLHTTPQAWEEKVDAARKAGSSLGAIVECVAEGVPAGWGAPVYAKLDGDLAAAMMSINAVKGVEIGDGFDAARLSGEENADAMAPGKNAPEFAANHAGGTAGGISTGQPVVCRVAFKPTSSILTPVDSINSDGEAVQVQTKGRHDPCVGIRAVPVGEAMMACVLLASPGSAQRRPNIVMIMADDLGGRDLPVYG